MTEQWGLNLLTPIACGLALLCGGPMLRASTIYAGGLSYDTFIPAGGGSPGVDAFDVANLTGDFSLPPDFPIVDGLTFQSAMLILTLSDFSQQMFDLGDIGPGFLLDGVGSPVVQVAGDQAFQSAEFVATLSPSVFMLADGSIVMVPSTALNVFLLPFSGHTLVVDVDQALIPASSSIPEPASAVTVLIGLAWLLFWRFRGVRPKPEERI